MKLRRNFGTGRGYFFRIGFYLLTGLLAVKLIVPGQVSGEVRKTPEKAMSERFPGASYEKLPLYITKEERARIEKELSVKLPGRFFTFHRAKEKGKVKGYVFFDTHSVRTKEETIAVFLNALGDVESVELISFFEPSEYSPPERWLKQFAGLKKAEPGVVMMTGATLTSHAVLNHVKLALDLFSLGRQKKKW